LGGKGIIEIFICSLLSPAMKLKCLVKAKTRLHLEKPRKHFIMLEVANKVDEVYVVSCVL
jgi:hypothetical protein